MTSPTAPIDEGCPRSIGLVSPIVGPSLLTPSAPAVGAARAPSTVATLPPPAAPIDETVPGPLD